MALACGTVIQEISLRSKRHWNTGIAGIPGNNSGKITTKKQNQLAQKIRPVLFCEGSPGKSGQLEVQRICTTGTESERMATC